MGYWLTAESSMGQHCSLQLDLTFFVCLFLCTFELSLLTFGAPRWLVHHWHPEEAAPLPGPFFIFPVAPLFFSPLLLLPTPARPCHLCVGCHSFSTNCFPAGWSQDLRWRKSQNEKGKEPRRRVESGLQVRNLQTNQVFTLSIGTSPELLCGKEVCISLLSLREPRRKGGREGAGHLHFG